MRSRAINEREKGRVRSRAINEREKGRVRSRAIIERGPLFRVEVCPRKRHIAAPGDRTCREMQGRSHGRSYLLPLSNDTSETETTAANELRLGPLGVWQKVAKGVRGRTSCILMAASKPDERSSCAITVRRRRTGGTMLLWVRLRPIDELSSLII